MDDNVIPESTPMSQWLTRIFAAITLAAVSLLTAGTVAHAADPQHEFAQQVAIPGYGAGVALDEDRGLVYVAARFNGAVYVYDEATLTLQNTIPVPNEPYNVAVGPTGVVYVTQYTGNNLPGPVSSIGPASHAIARRKLSGWRDRFP